MTHSENGFSQKRSVAGQLNSSNLEAHSYISPQGDFLLFDSDRPGGFDETDIYVSFKSESLWSEGINLGEKINKGKFSFPSLSPDGDYIFINSGGDIYWVKADIIEELRPEK